MEPRFAPGVSTPASMTVTSEAFREGGRLPVDNTCDGAGNFPPLTLSSAPEAAKSLVLVVEDPDVGTALMVAFDLAPTTRTLTGDLKGAGPEARLGANDARDVAFAAPCPAQGEGRRYRFRVIALDKALGLREGATREAIEREMDGHVLGEGSLTGWFAH